jgi:hypothetical protein
MQDTIQSVSSEINFDVTNLPINTRLSFFLNDVDYTPLVCPNNGLIGDPVITDNTGNAKGKILVLSSYAIQIGGNSLIIKVFTTIIIIIVGFYIFEEKFTWSKIIGIIILLTGLYLLSE